MTFIHFLIALYFVHGVRLQSRINWFDHNISKQEEIDFQKIRDLCVSANKAEYPTKLPLYLIAKVLALKLNLSLMTYDSDDPSTWYLLSKRFNLEHSTIIPEMATFGFEYFTPLYQWEKYNISKEKPSFVQTQSREMNFIYCDLPKWKKEPVWILTDITKIFGKFIWTLLVISLITTCLILGTEQLVRHFVVLLSCVLCSGICGSINKRKAHFYIWLLFVRIVMDMYSGEVASRLISPAEEVTLETSHDLSNANYSAVTRNSNETTATKIFLHKLTSKDFGSILNSDSFSLKQMFDRAVILSNSTESANFTKVATSIFVSYSSSLAFFHYWYKVIHIAGLIESIQEHNQNSTFAQPLCYLGKRLVSPGSFFWGFLPPNTKELVIMFRWLVNSGIVSRMENEGFMLSHSRRVQDRIRVKTKTVFVPYHKIREAVYYPQQLNGKILKVFFIWGVMILICLVAFVLELHSANSL